MSGGPQIRRPVVIVAIGRGIAWIAIAKGIVITSNSLTLGPRMALRTASIGAILSGYTL